MIKTLFIGLILFNSNLALANNINFYMVKYFNIDKIKNPNKFQRSKKINIITSCNRCDTKSINNAEFLPIQESIVDVTMLFDLNNNNITKVLLLKLNNDSSLEFVNYFKINENKNVKNINIRIKQNCPESFITLLMYVETINKTLYGSSTVYSTSCSSPGL